ncbi:MBOAT family protein [Paenibacillus sp. LjRoot153]|uniref:MBOAT family O-acyltransferase n=1 Tax=Paenibacillus sp. LjRoot153 TaxID=3342270 RepID=UPI003ECC2B24
MIFNEWAYAIILLIGVPIFYFVPLHYKSIWITLIGTVFYIFFAGSFAFLLLLEAIVVYFLVRKMKSWNGSLIITLIFTIGILGYYKYKNMALLTFSNVFSLNYTVESLVIPLAISFFTFEFIHYAVDARKKKLPEHSFLDYMAFIMFFPTMVAGPIKRFQQFIPKITEIEFSWENIRAGLQRILIGMFKKVVIADTMDVWTIHLQSNEIYRVDGQTLWVWVIAYAIKIYMDFSGYSDIAIGSARLFGVNVPENFNWPYLAQNPSDFWRRWHISLSRWITDYVYIPLGGSRKSLWRSSLNSVAAMGISGLWHGAAWNFVAWGIYHGLLLTLYRIWRKFINIEKYSIPNFITTPIAIVITFLAVAIGWVFFILPIQRAFYVILKMIFIR